MKLTIGSDHAAYTAKETLIAFLDRHGHTVVDVGTGSENSCDYADFAFKVVRHVLDGKADFGILVCGTGIGMSIAANRFTGIRAALCHDLVTASMSRAHNDANILCMGARVLSPELMKEIVLTFLKIDFAGGRHSRRLSKIDDLKE